MATLSSMGLDGRGIPNSISAANIRRPGNMGYNREGIPNAVALRPQGYKPPATISNYSQTTSDVPAPAAPTRDYYAEYQSSLAKARAGIEGQYKAALTDLNSREGLAGQAVNLLPGQVNDIYAKSAANLTQGANTLDAAQKGTNLTSYATAGQQMAPLNAALGMDQGARLADVPLLRLGNAATFQQQRGALQNAQISATDDIDKEQRGYLTQLDQQQRQAAIDAQARQETRYNDVQDKDWLAQQDFERQLTAKGIEGRQAKAEEARAANVYGGADTTAERGQFLKTYNQPLYKKVTSSDAYRQAESMIGRDKPSHGYGLGAAWNTLVGRQYSVNDAIESLKRRGLFRTAAALQYRHNSTLGKQPVATK